MEAGQERNGGRAMGGGEDAAALADVLRAVAACGGRLTAAAWQDDTVLLALAGCRPESVASRRPCAVSLPADAGGFELLLRVPVCPPRAAHGAASAADVLRAVHSALASCGAALVRGQTDGGSLSVQCAASPDALGFALACCMARAERLGWSERSASVRSGATGCDLSLTIAAGLRAHDPSPLRTLARHALLFAPEDSVCPRHAGNPPPVRARIAAVRRMDGTRFVYYRLGSGRIICEQEIADG